MVPGGMASAISSSVKAWVYTSGGYPTSLTLSTITPPSEPAANHVLVRIHATALNPVDIQMINFPIWSLPKLGYPKTVSSDFSGTVVAASPETGYANGDEVFGFNMAPFMYASGTMAEISHLDLAKTTIARKPREWSHTQAACIGCVWLTAHTCIELCDPYVRDTREKRVAVLGGSSATGMYSIWIAKQRGWKVLTTCSGRNADFVTQDMGSDLVIDYTKESVREKVKDFQPSAVIDCVGGIECLGIAPRYVSIVGDKTTRTTMGDAFLYLYNPQMVWRWL